MASATARRFAHLRTRDGLWQPRWDRRSPLLAKAVALHLHHLSAVIVDGHDQRVPDGGSADDPGRLLGGVAEGDNGEQVTIRLARGSLASDLEGLGFIRAGVRSRLLQPTKP
jgi:hypothetical protein